MSHGRSCYSVSQDKGLYCVSEVVLVSVVVPCSRGVTGLYCVTGVVLAAVVLVVSVSQVNWAVLRDLGSYCRSSRPMFSGCHRSKAVLRDCSSSFHTGCSCFLDISG